MQEAILGHSEDQCDYYSVLGCQPSSTEEQILAEYRIRAKDCHPDRQEGRQGATQEGREGATKEFQRIQEAKEILLDKVVMYLVMDNFSQQSM